VEKIKEGMFLGWGIISNYEFNPLGRIWVCWYKEDLKIDLIGKVSRILVVELRLLRRIWFGFNLLFMVLIREQIKEDFGID